MIHQKSKPCTERSECIGFTLIELIIVMVIVAITMAFSIPRLGSIFDATSFNRIVNKVIVFLRDARVDALSTGKKISIVVDLEDGKLIRLTDGGEERNLQMPDEITIGVEREDRLKVVNLPSFGRDENIEFNFYPNGTASGPRLLMKDTNTGRNAIIYLEPLAGLVRYKIGNWE